MDWVIIENLELSVQIGCNSEERSRPQRIMLCSRIGCDIGAAVASGNVSDSVCYLKVCMLAREVLENRPWILLEQAGVSFIESIFENFPAAREVQLILKKFVVSAAQWTGIEIKRNREQLGVKG